MRTYGQIGQYAPAVPAAHQLWDLGQAVNLSEFCELQNGNNNTYRGVVRIT